LNEPHDRLGLREKVAISHDLLHALTSAAVVYLLLWPSDEAPHSLVISAFPHRVDRAYPANFKTTPAFLFVPPARALHPSEPHNPSPLPPFLEPLAAPVHEGDD